MSEALLSISQVAERCGLSSKAVRGAVSRGELGASKLCNRIRVHPKDLEMWVAARRIGLGARTSRSVPASSQVRSGLRRLLQSEGGDGER